MEIQNYSKRLGGKGAFHAGRDLVSLKDLSEICSGLITKQRVAEPAGRAQLRCRLCEGSILTQQTETASRPKSSDEEISTIASIRILYR